jgi:hypothetical protein
MLESCQVLVKEQAQMKVHSGVGLHTEVPVAQHRCSSLSISTSTKDVGGARMEEKKKEIPQKDKAHLSNVQLLSQIHPIEPQNQATDPGTHVPGSLPTRRNAEDGIADLSNNTIRQGKTGGLWDAIKEFLCTITGYSMYVLKWYWDTVRPVFSIRPSSHWSWRHADQEDDEQTNLGAVCLSLPLFIVFSMLLAWSMELAVMSMECMDEEWDCLVDKTLLMFRRSLTGVYD